MAFYQLRQIQTLPITLEKAWEFFSNPANLNEITPDDMEFVITSPVLKGEIYAGQIITYKVSPVLNVPLVWATEITQVRAPYYFSDNQLYGPYRFWHHEHHFKAMPSGIEMTDILYYELPFGVVGDFVHRLFVRKRIETIFEYRRRKLEKIFPKQT